MRLPGTMKKPRRSAIGTFCFLEGVPASCLAGKSMKSSLWFVCFTITKIPAICVKNMLRI